MNNISASEKKWMQSFAIIDVAFWLLIFGGCALNADGCLESISGVPVVIYAPFWLLLSPLWNILPKNPLFTATLLVIVGFCGHILIGWLMGRILQNRSVRWYVSIPASFVVLFLLVNIAWVSAYMLGMIR